MTPGMTFGTSQAPAPRLGWKSIETMERKQMNPKGKRSWWRVTAIVLGVLVLLGAVLGLVVRHRIPPGLGKDIRAGIASRHIKDPDERLKKYLEGRYGPLSEPANRQQAFLDFFNTDHIKALQLLVRHSPESQRQSNILAMARWVESYRNGMTPQERADLKTRLQGPEAAAMLKRATTQYNSQDVAYRGATAPVISQLLQTISSVQKP